MTASAPEWLQILVGSLLLLSPLAVAVGLIVCTYLLRAHRMLAYVPAACAASGAIVGLIIMRSATEGLQGLGEVLLGFYLLSVGGLATVICAVMVYTASRGSAGSAGRPTRDA